MAEQRPSNWAQYDRGASPGLSESVSSVANQSVHFEEDALLGGDDGHEHDDQLLRGRQRRSSVTNTLAAITGIGGANSLRSFGRSWQRAAAFPEIIPQRPAFIFAPDQEPVHTTEPIQYRREDAEAGQRTSLLGPHLRGDSPDHALVVGGFDESNLWEPPLSRTDSDERKRFGSDLYRRDSNDSGSPRNHSIFSIPPHLAVPQIGSLNSIRSYGTVESETSHSSMRQAADHWRQEQELVTDEVDVDRPAVLVKEVEQDGRIVLAVSGQSTLPQTVVNSINVLIGVGLLSLPMGLKYAGWVCGLSTLILCAMVTRWTAKILAKCMDLDATLITFSDVAFIAFGKWARFATSILFTLELLAACVALLVLFADSLVLLFPGTLTNTEWKIVCTLVLIPLQFAPLKLLSYTSFVGILCCLSIVFIVFLDGLIKPHTPGSLIEPAATYLFPANWLTLPLSFGLLMSPWGGHSVFPNIYRDMRHPQRYHRAVNYTFVFSFIVDAAVATVGLLMFGDGVRDEITANILEITGYPHVLKVLLVIFIAIIPLTKIPLNAQPVVTTLELLFGLRYHQIIAEEDAHRGSSPRSTWLAVQKAFIRVLTVMIFLAIAILFPAFDAIMAFMGSALCFTICVTLPLAFYLRLFGHQLSVRERIFTFCVMCVSLTISMVGTVWAFLPRSLIGAA